MTWILVLILLCLVRFADAGTLTFGAVNGNCTDGTKWVGGVAPTAADDALLIVTSANMTVDTGCVMRSINATGYVGVLTHTAGVTWAIGDATAGLGNVALEFPTSGWTYTLGSGSTSIINFISTSATQQTVNFGGKTTGPVTFNAASNGSWLYTGAHVTTNANATWNLTKGTVDLNGQTLTFVGTLRSNSSSNVRVLTLGAATISTGQWDLGSGVNLAFSGASSSVTMIAAATVFNGGGKTYGGVTVAAAGTGLVIAGANTFTNFTVAAPKTLQFTAATTTTFLNAPTLIGTAGNVITISSATAATHTLSLAAGTVNGAYLNITNSLAGGGATWNAGDGSIDGGGNTGWIFPTAGNGFFMLLER